MIRLLVLLVWGIGTQASSGAWPRDKGHGFVSGSALYSISLADVERTLTLGDSRDISINSYTALYMEYGLTDRLTVGLDLGHSVAGKVKSVGFVRWPLPELGNGHRIALEIGTGRIDGQNAIRPGISYGRGISWRQWSGWLAIDTLAEYRPKTASVDIKVDATFGLNMEKGRKAILQIQMGEQDGDPPFARLVGSVVTPVYKRTHLELGFLSGLSGDDQVGVKLGFWHEF